MNNKKRWTVIDTLIVVLVIVAGVAVFKVFGGNARMSGNTKTIDAVVLLAQEDSEVGEAMTVGDEITISLTEKDSGTLKDVRVEPSETQSERADGKHVYSEMPDRYDATITIKAHGQEAANSYITADSEDLSVGRVIDIYTKYVLTSGKVMSVTKE